MVEICIECEQPIDIDNPIICSNCLVGKGCALCNHEFVQGDQCVACIKCDSLYCGPSCFRMSGGCCKRCVECNGRRVATRPAFDRVMCAACWRNYHCEICTNPIQLPVTVCDNCKSVFHQACMPDGAQCDCGILD